MNADELSSDARARAAIDAIARGEFVVVADDEDRENEGDLIMAADAVDAEALAFLVRHTSGLICVGITGERADELQLQPMVAVNTESMGTAFTPQRRNRSFSLTMRFPLRYSATFLSSSAYSGLSGTLQETVTMPSPRERRRASNSFLSPSLIVCSVMMPLSLANSMRAAR